MKKFLLGCALLVGSIIALPQISNAQVGINVDIGGPPVCQWGYYPDYPYGCAPYGYYDNTWFLNGIFIGAGPWFHYRHGYGHPEGWYRSYYGSHGGGHVWDNHARSGWHGNEHQGGGHFNGGHMGGHGHGSHR